MMTERRAKRNSQSSARVTQFYPLSLLTLTSFRVDSEDDCIGVSKIRRSSGTVHYYNDNDARDGSGTVVGEGGGRVEGVG